MTNPENESSVPFKSIISTTTRWRRHICCCCPIALTCCGAVPAPVVHPVPILRPVPVIEPVPFPLSAPNLQPFPVPHPLFPVARPLPPPVPLPIFHPFPTYRSFGIPCCVCCMPVCVQKCIGYCTTIGCGAFSRKKRAVAMNKYYATNGPFLT
ncbi:unnamed protein product [Onchocerca ochengi]|uniref:Uncharacterized protein n=1 Tax=Onchocerca ochengi TaxID=42157 RepID=A0A182DX80_ONCOC|nr:unnamed protein product [Onchocerca ochengi]